MIAEALRPAVALALVGLTGALLGPELVSAQSQTTTTSDPAPPWSYACQESADKTQKLCRIMQNLTVKRGDQQQRLLTVIVRPQAKAKNHGLLIALPHGLFLPAGIEIKVDDNQPVKMVIQTSDAKGAYAGIAISDELLADLKKGIKLSVTFMSAVRKPVTVPVSLNGFTASYGKL